MPNHDRIPNTDSIEELAHFWDTHDVTDYESELVEVTEPVFLRSEKDSRTLTNLYLSKEPTGVKVEDDHLVILLDDGNDLSIPLQFLGQLSLNESLPDEAELLILRHPPQIDHVHVTERALQVYLTDGRMISCPLSWFPRLLHGTPAERTHYVLGREDSTMHWPDLDEDIELSGLFVGGKSAESEASIQRWLASRQKIAQLLAA